MSLSRKRKFVIGGVAALAILGGGGAIAATQLTPSERSTAIINDAAGQLGVQPSALSNALKKAEENQIDADVTAGRLTQAQADKIKAAIESGQAPVIGGGGPGLGGGFGRHGGFGFGGPGGPGGNLDAAATYLGVSADTLRTDLESGQSLADVAKATQGKSVDGLVSALVDAEKTEIQSAVTAGHLTQDQATQIESNLQQRVTDVVNGTRPAGGPGFGPRHGGFGGDDDGGGPGFFGGGAPGGGTPGGTTGGSTGTF